MLFVINIFFFNDLSLNNRREGQESAQEYDVSSELISQFGNCTLCDNKFLRSNLFSKKKQQTESGGWGGVCFFQQI